MDKKTRLYVGIAAASVVIILIVQYCRWYSYWRQELSSDGPLHIDSLSLSESKARLEFMGGEPVILFPPKNWDKVAAVARQLCLDVGCVKAVQTTDRHRGPPLGFSIMGHGKVNGRNSTFCNFRFEFYDLNDSSIKLTVFEYPGASPRHTEEYLIKELARRIGIPVDVSALD